MTPNADADQFLQTIQPQMLAAAQNTGSLASATPPTPNTLNSILPTGATATGVNPSSTNPNSLLSSASYGPTGTPTNPTDLRIRLSPLNTAIAQSQVYGTGATPTNTSNPTAPPTSPITSNSQLYGAAYGSGSSGSSASPYAQGGPSSGVYGQGTPSTGSPSTNLAASGSNLLAPLVNTNGLMFPYSPQITVEQTVLYQDINMVHTNADFLAYQRTPSVTISITGKFTVQTQTEGIYALACIHFLRVVSKMYFGQNYNGAPSTLSGLPPPILLLNGYGSYMFNNLRVILKSHSYTYNETMDTVLINTAGGTVRLPALFDLSATLVVQQTPRAAKADFDLGLFRTGQLMLKGGWI